MPSFPVGYCPGKAKPMQAQVPECRPKFPTEKGLQLGSVTLKTRLTRVPGRLSA